jgi:hypothetical protein
MRKPPGPAVILVLGLALCALPACSDPAGARPDLPRPTVTLSVRPDTQGVLGRVSLAAEVLDEAGNPLQDRVVEWRVRSRGGVVGMLDPRRPAEQTPWVGPFGATVTGHDGMARTLWRLGGAVGRQWVEASVGGSDTVAVAVEALAGAVFVGRWRESSGLPPTTISLHAAHLPHIERALELLGAGGIVRIYGPIRAGPGVDREWPFHLDPTYVQAVPLAGSVECTSRPPGSVEEAQALQGGEWVMLCPWVLDLIAVEEVPSWYLEELRPAGG